MRRRAIVQLLALGLTICGLAGCHTPNVSSQQMRDFGIRVLIQRDNASRDPNIVRYASVADFIRRNPGCCALHSIADPEVLVWNVELTVLYRRQASGPHPYCQATFQFGPKLENFDDSASALSAEEYHLFLAHRGEDQIIG